MSLDQRRSEGYIGIYTHPKLVHLKFVWGVFFYSYEAEHAEHQQATAIVEAIGITISRISY